MSAILQPPAYEADPAKLPTYDEAIKSVLVREVQNEPEKIEQNVDINLYQTSVVPKDDLTSQPVAFGFLKIGLKKPMDVLKHFAAYRNPTDEAEYLDISAGIEVFAVPGQSSLTRYVKHSDPTLSPFSFDIQIKDLGGEKSTFEGTFFNDLDENEYVWKGTQLFKGTEKVSVTKKIGIPEPTNTKGSLQVLIDLSPLAYKKEGEVDQGQDLAQSYGDRMWQKISVHALDAETKQKLIGEMPELSGAEKSILHDNGDFFRLFAIHDLAERLKKLPELGDDVKKHVMFKKYWFQLMMTSYVPPQASSEPDPVVMYGWDRTKNAATLEKLQRQYLDVTMRCYETGYIAKVPLWQEFLTQPSYWFRVYAAYLESEEHINPWLLTLPSRKSDKNALTPEMEIVQWGNKLTLLKHAADRAGASDANDLDVKRTTDILNSALQTHLSYAQLVNADLASHAHEIFKDLDKASDEYKKNFEKASDEAKKLAVEIRINLSRVLFELSSPGTAMHDLIARGQSRKLPPGSYKIVDGKLTSGGGHTFGQIYDVLDAEGIFRNWEKEQAVLRRGMMSDEYAPAYKFAALFEQPKMTFKEYTAAKASEWLKDAKKAAKDLNWWGKILKGILHCAAIGLMFHDFFANKSKMDGLNKAMAALQMTSFTIDSAAKVGRFLARKLFMCWDYGRTACGGVVAWFSKTVLEQGAKFGKRFVHSLVGNFSKVIRLIGLAGCVLGLISTWDALDKAKNLTPGDRRIYTIFNRIQFWLGVIEGAAIAGEILLEMAGMMTASMLCGALGAVAGILGVIVLVVYLTWFAPDPQAEAKKFLKETAGPVGSYNESKEAWPADEPGVEVHK